MDVLGIEQPHWEHEQEQNGGAETDKCLLHDVIIFSLKVVEFEV